MLYHSSHKWLLHLDGQSCSSRLEQLLALGSLVVKEESGGGGRDRGVALVKEVASAVQTE